MVIGWSCFRTVKARGCRGMLKHPLVPGAVFRDVSQCRGWAGFNTHGLASTQVALSDHTGIRIVIDSAEGAGNRANFTSDANLSRDLLSASDRVQGNRLYRADHHTPSFFTLGTGRGNIYRAAIENGDIHNRLGRIKGSHLTVGAHHFALMAARAGIYFHDQRFMHTEFP